jgi:DNA-directed RNA polymerase sigma subunit (sigma70/sigma32)
MSNYTNLPAPSPEQGLNRYMQDIRKFPMLEPDEEYMLAKAWKDHGDTDAAHVPSRFGHSSPSTAAAERQCPVIT